MKWLLITVVFYSLSFIGQTPLNDLHWNLSWQDNFNYINHNIWDIADSAEGNNNTVYLDDNVTVSGGKLIITANDNYMCCPDNPISIWGAHWPCRNKCYNYTSGSIVTTPAYSQQFGYIEAKIKTDYGIGYFPAFWTFIAQGAIGNSEEIDIFEMLGSLPANTMTSNIHDNYCDSLYLSTHSNCGNIPEFYEENQLWFNYQENYHLYAIEWSPGTINWYVDHVKIRTSYSHDITSPVRIILNFALGDYGSNQPNSTTNFPATMKIDYVRVYDKVNDCSNSINVCSYDMSNLDGRLKKNVIIGGSGCSSSVPLGTRRDIRAVEFIEIKGEFIVPLDSELNLETMSCF